MNIKMISFLCTFIPMKKKRRAVRKNWIWNTILKEIDRDKETMLSGLSPEKRTPRLIVSMTSFPARIERVYVTAYSLLAQSMKADEVVLWLGADKFPEKEKELPPDLLSLREKGLTIRWVEDIRSYTKLVPALKEFPDDIIVTADDDLYYPREWLEKLYDAYLKEPNLIHCHRAHTITFDKNGEVADYADWKRHDKCEKATYLNFLTGVGGVLYPPHCLDEAVMDKALFKELAPTADDIWFWAMAVKNGTKIRKLPDLMMENPIQMPDTLEDAQALALINCQGGRNTIQMKAVLEKYPELMEKLKEEI